MARSFGTQARERATQKRSSLISQEEIARVAYELFERRGGVHGHDEEDWLEAERIVRSRHSNGSGR